MVYLKIDRLALCLQMASPLNPHTTMKKSLMNRFLGFVAVPIAMAFAVESLPAETVIYNLTNKINGILIPGATSTWAGVAISDISGGVSLTFSISPDLALNPNTSGTFISAWYLNFDQTKTISSKNLVSQVGQFVMPTVDVSNNNFDPANFSGSPKNFDIRIDFGNSGGPTKRFGVGESATFNFLGTVTAKSFDVLNNTPPSSGENAAAVGLYHEAAEVQGYTFNGTTSSATYVTAPEPTAALLLLMGAGIYCVVLRKRPIAEA